MMANEFYNHGNLPADNSPGSSAEIRAEFDFVTAGFAKMPVMATNGGKVVKVNVGGTALETKASDAEIADTVHAATAKTTPVDADELGIWNSVTSLLNKVTWANLKATLAAWTGWTTQPPPTSNGTAATTAFVQAISQLSMATVPLANITGGTYSLASLGSGCVLNITASGGAITAATVGTSGGAGYAVGDILAVQTGNYDSYLRVATVSGSAVATLTVLYGGTGHTTASNVATARASAVPFKWRLSGTLTSNATFILPNGTYLANSEQYIVSNNTTGAFTVSFFVSNGSNATTGTGVVIPQGTGNSLNAAIETDGVTDVWFANRATDSFYVSGSAKMLQQNAGAFGSGEWSRNANWGAYFKAPAAGSSADIALVDSTGVVGLHVGLDGIGYQTGIGGGGRLRRRRARALR